MSHEMIEEWEIYDLLSALIDKSLVVFEEKNGAARYTLLEMVSQYSEQKLQEANETKTLRNLHKKYYLPLAIEMDKHYFTAEQAACMAQIELEHDNLRAVLDWCLDEGGDMSDGSLLLSGMQSFWQTSGFINEGRQRLDQAIAGSGFASASPADQARILSSAGSLAYCQGDYAAASDFFTRTLEIYKQQGNQVHVAGYTLNLGSIAQYQGNFTEAKKRFEEALAINRELGKKKWEAGSLICLGSLAHSLGNDEEARSSLEQALEIAREIGDQQMEGHSLNQLGVIWLNEADYETAVTMLEQALAINREIGARIEEGSTLCSLGNAALLRGDYAAARAFHRESLTLLKHLEFKYLITSCLEGIGSLASAQFQFERAAKLWGASDALHTALKAPPPPAAHARQIERRKLAREALGEDAFNAAWNEGQYMTFEEAVEFALGDEQSLNLKSDEL